MERFTNPAYSFTAYCRARSAGELRQAEIGGSARADEMVRSRPNPTTWLLIHSSWEVLCEAGSNPLAHNVVQQRLYW